MASFSFNGINMSGYGLTVKKTPNVFAQLVRTMQMQRRGYNLGVIHPADSLSLPVIVEAENTPALLSRIDDISRILNTTDDKVLILDRYPDRYWMACFEGFAEGKYSPTSWDTVITFRRSDPRAYANTPTSHNVIVDASPHAANETAGGIVAAAPVITLTKQTAISLDFETGDYLTHGLSISSATDFSLEIWIKVNTMPTAGKAAGIIDFRTAALRGIGIDLHNDGLAYFQMRDAGGSLVDIGSPVLTVETWALLLATYETSTNTMKFYCDGVYINSAVGKTILATTLSVIGGNSIISGTAESLAANLKMARVYNRVLGATEALVNYVLGHLGCPDPTNSTGLIGYWKLNDNTGATAVDSGSGGNNGTITGAAWVDDSPVGATTVTIVNTTSGESFEWTGDLVAADVLVIDNENGTVKLNGVSSLASQDGQFIHLSPGVNDIDISGFSGTLNYAYSARY